MYAFAMVTTVTLNERCYSINSCNIALPCRPICRGNSRWSSTVLRHFALPLCPGKVNWRLRHRAKEIADVDFPVHELHGQCESIWLLGGSALGTVPSEGPRLFSVPLTFNIRKIDAFDALFTSLSTAFA